MTARLLFALLIGLSALLPIEGEALSLSPGPELILNWDLTGATPAPPYTFVKIDLLLDSNIPFSPSQDLAVTLYNDLNGGGGALSGPNHLGIDPPGTTTTSITFTADSGCCPTLFDGVFSVGFTVTREGTEIVSATAMGTVATGSSTPDVPGVVPPSNVPEPSTFALVALGLVIFGVISRHRLHLDVCGIRARYRNVQVPENMCQRPPTASHDARSDGV